MKMNSIIPELDVSDLQRSLEFYLNVLGFGLMYQRAEEKFAFLQIDEAQLMLEEAAGPGRRFHTAALEHPFGRGMNLQIRVSDVDAIWQRCLAEGSQIVIPLEERWYRRDDQKLGNRQFVVADPDGYLLRFFTDLGQRACDE